MSNNAYILACWRETPLELDEIVNGEVWTNLGGIYRMEIEQVVEGNGHEIAYGFQWLYSTLANDATLAALVSGVFRGLAPATAAVPYVIMSHQAGSDALNAFGVRVMSNLLYQVKAVGPGNIFTTLMSAAERIDKLLGGTTAGPAAGFI
jgi:hypothetical protein